MSIKKQPQTLDKSRSLCNHCNGTLHAQSNNLTHKAQYVLAVYSIGTCGVIGVTYYPENAQQNYGLVLRKEQNVLVTGHTM